MRRGFALIALALLAGGCEKPLSAEQKELADARDVQQVEAAHNVAPPIAAFAPEPITFADIENNKLFGASCIFLPADGGDTYVALAMAGAAYIKIGGDLRVYAADKGSPPLPLGNWSRYEGRENVIDLQTTGGANGEGGTPSGEETTDWPGRLTVRDPYDRVVYSAPGTVQCGA